MNTVRFAIIGYGHIGRRHAQHILQHPEAQLCSICELPGQERPAGLPAHIAWYTDAETMLTADKPDVLNVCTPNYLHHTHSILALQHGVHVLCEKPMAISTSACDAMIAAAQEANKRIFVVKQNRYNEPVQQVKHLLEQNILGQVFMVNVNCFWNRNEAYYNQSPWRGSRKQDGGCLFTQFSHFVDILFYLFGDVENIRGLIRNFNHAYTDIEDSGSFIMQTPAGALINFNFSTCSYEKNMEGAFTILAEKGTVKIGGQYLNTIEYQQISNHVLPPVSISGKANDYGLYQGSMSNHDQVIANVIDTLHGRASIMTSAYEGRKVVDIIERMYQGAR